MLSLKTSVLTARDSPICMADPMLRTLKPEVLTG